jgi:PIN domain nuclease of toxin-antitoxin system
VRKALLDEANEVYASVVSVWEISLKVGGWKAQPSGQDELSRGQLSKARRAKLPANRSLARASTGEAPLHSQNPFDRILVPQAMVEGWTLVTKDENLAKYPAKVFW